MLKMLKVICFVMCIVVSLYGVALSQSLDEEGKLLNSSSSIPISGQLSPESIGDVINSFPNPANIFGLAFRDGNLWGVNDYVMELYEMDPDTGAVLSTVSISGSGNPSGLGWDFTRGNFVVTDASSDVFLRVDLTGTIITSFPTSGPGPVGAAYDSIRDGYWISDWVQNRVYLLDPDTGAEIASLPVPAGASRIAGTGYDPNNDVIMLHSRDSAETYLMRASDGVQVGVFPTPPSSGINNGKGAAIRPSDLTGYITNYNVATIFVVDLALAAECTLDMNLSYTNDTLTMDFDLGTTQPVNWNVWLSFQTTTFPLWSAPIPVIDPPISFPISIPGFPHLGIIGVLTTLTTSDGIICSDWETVDTGPTAATVEPNVEDLKKLFR